MRRWLNERLDPELWSKAGLSPINIAISIAILFSVVVSVLETEPLIRTPYLTWFYVTDILLGVLFIVEYVVRVWVAGENGKYAGFLGRLKYIITPAALVDLLAILPFLVSSGTNDAFLLRLFRLFRIFTLAKLGRYSSALKNVTAAIRSRAHELLTSLLAALLVMFLAAAALYLTEGSTNPESFGSIPRAMWWGVATISKVGYAGAFPVTVLGKVFAAFFAIGAVGVVALPTGILAAAMSEAFQRNQTRPKKE